MKSFLAFVGGFVLSLAIFFSGIVMAITYFHAEPVKIQQVGRDVAHRWTAEPEKVEPAAQAFERIAVDSGQPEAKQPRAVPQGGAVTAAAAASSSAEVDAAEVDTMTTAAVASGSDPALRSPEMEAMAAAHADSCASPYSSYRPSRYVWYGRGDYCFWPYSGGRRRCISPYSEASQGIAATPVSAEPEADGYVHAEDEASTAYVEYASDDMQLDGDHIDYCFSRYRSYRPEDNTYQPFGGGPRRQCE